MLFINKWWGIFPIALGFVLAGCLQSGSVGESGTIGEVVPVDPETLVCNPFDGNEGSQAPEQGIAASLFYLDSTQPNYRYVQEYFDYGHKVDDIKIYFNQLYIPTRPFDRGFVTEAGQSIQTEEGDTLYEWFALKFEGHLQLKQGQLAGLYQFAILSDDGAILKVDTDNDGQWEVLIDNDNFHPTRMGCAADAIYLDENSRIPFELDYFQGPRYHISLVLLSRPWTGSPSDIECGRQGNSRYFDYTQDPPVPTSTYNALISRGWSVLGVDNFSLPGEDENPCNSAPVVISGVNLFSLEQTSLTIDWLTDLPATSQVFYKDIVTGVQLETAMNMDMVTSHRVEVTGLKSNTVYEVQVVSSSAAGVLSSSDPLVLRTSR